MEPEKTYDIQEVDVVYLPKRHSKEYWYDNNDSTIRNYITGKDNPSFSGIGLRGLERARNEYMSLGNTFRRKPLSAPEMARLDNEYGIDQSLFDIARSQVESNYQNAEENYNAGKISDRKWNRLSKKYDRELSNLNENHTTLDQHQNPLKYIRVHKDGDIAPLLFSLGLPAAIIGGIKTAPYMWRFLNHPITQTVGTIDGIRNLFTGNGVQKTYNHFKNGEYGKGALSLTGDILDATPGFNFGKNAYRFTKIIKNSEIERRRTLDDTINTAVSYWKRQIDPNISREDYYVTHDPSLRSRVGFEGIYYPDGQAIVLNNFRDRNTLIHEMRHQADPEIHGPTYGMVLGGEDELPRKYGNMPLTSKEKKILKNVYNQPNPAENIAINAEMRAGLESFMQREQKIVPTKSMLDDYIHELPSSLLSLQRAISGYASWGGILKTLYFPNLYKNAIINIK